MNNEELDFLLDECAQFERDHAPRPHRDQTDACPPLISLLEGSRTAWKGWPEAATAHVRGCGYCQKTTEQMWAAGECLRPAVLTLAARLADTLEPHYLTRVNNHLEQDRCPRCTRLTNSLLVRALAGLLRVGKSLDLTLMELDLALSAMGNFARPQERIFKHEAGDTSSVTVHENDRRELLVSVDVRYGAPHSAVRLEILGEYGQQAETVPLEALSGFGSVADARIGTADQISRTLGRDLVIQVAVPSSEAIQKIVEWMSDANRDVRLAAVAAVDALGTMTPSVVDQLLNVCHDPDETVRAVAGDALRKFGRGAPSV